MSNEIKNLVKNYFNVTNEDNSRWQCKCGKILTQRKNTGWSNLFNHVKTQHPEYQKLLKPALSIDKFIKKVDTSTKSNNIYGWLNWTCCGLKPFSFVENELTRTYTSLTLISEKTLKKYMNLLTKEVEKKITNLLPSKFCLVLDGWTKKSTHFVGVFASYYSHSPGGYNMVLLSFSPLLNETSFTAVDHLEFLESILEIYGSSFSNVVAICGDNAEVNKALATLCGVPLVGCASHRFNLAVIDYLKPYDVIISKVNSLMVKLKSLKISGILRKHTSLCPIKKNETRWSSIADMMCRYEQLKCFISNAEHITQPCLVNFIPTARENTVISELLTHLKKFNSITIALQRVDISILEVHYLHDEIIREYPTFGKYLMINSKIVHSPIFESALIKIQDNKLYDLSPEEQIAASNLMLSSSDLIMDTDFSSGSDDFAGSVLRKRKMEKQSNISKYMDTRFVVPTSNAVERLFSMVGYAFSDMRQRLLPVNLEMQVFLKSNKHLWNEALVSQIISSNK